MQRSNSIIPIGAALMLALIGCENHVDVSVPATPFKIVAQTPGNGQLVEEGYVATISYQVTLPDGRELLEHPKFKFFVSKDRPSIIQGINDAVIGMRVGGSKTIDCPPHLHWGRGGSGDGRIPPNTHLTICIEILALE